MAFDVCSREPSSWYIVAYAREGHRLCVCGFDVCSRGPSSWHVAYARESHRPCIGSMWYEASDDLFGVVMLGSPRLDLPLCTGSL